MNNFRHCCPIRDQQGSVMIGAMIVLLLLTLLAVSSMSSSTMQERMTLNSHQYANGLSATESGVRAGEAAISSAALTVPPPPGPPAGATCSGVGCVVSCQTSTPICFVWNNAAWDAGVTGPEGYRTNRTDVGIANWWADRAIAFNRIITGPVGAVSNPLVSDNRQIPAVAAPPGYIIEDLGQAPISRTLTTGDPSVTYENFYQITSRGVARSDASDVDSRVVQSVYGRIFE